MHRGSTGQEGRPDAPARTAVITGASRGLGRALARELAAGGWRLVVDARDAGALRAALPAGRVEHRPGDVTDAGHRRELAGAAGDRVDLLVLNASTLGQTPLPKLAEHGLDELRTTFETNVVAGVALVQELLPALRRARGSVIAVTSDAAVEGYPGWGGYGASKAALEAVARVFAAEEPDLRVYAFDPGDMRTDMHQAAFPGEDISDRPEAETVVPAMRRLIQGELASGRWTASGLLVGEPA